MTAKKKVHHRAFPVFDLEELRKMRIGFGRLFSKEVQTMLELRGKGCIFSVTYRPADSFELPEVSYYHWNGNKEGQCTEVVQVTTWVPA